MKNIYTETKSTEVLWEVINYVVTSSIKLVVGLLFLFIGFKIVDTISKTIKKSLIKREVDKTIVQVTNSFIRKGGKLLVFVCLLGYVGFDTAALASLIAAVGVGISLATQGALSNFAGGIVILITRPFKLGDYVESIGVSGTVEDIKIFYTQLVTPDNKVVLIPNGTLSSQTIINYSTKDVRRVDLRFNISYKDDFEYAQNIIRKVAEKNELVLQNPIPFIKVIEHASSSITIVCRLWTKNNDYWSVYFYMLEEVKKEFDNENISIPYTKIDIHLDK